MSTAPDLSALRLDLGATETQHVYCECSPERTLCGLADDMEFIEDLEPTCVVCLELEPMPCERCGT